MGMRFGERGEEDEVQEANKKGKEERRQNTGSEVAGLRIKLTRAARSKRLPNKQCPWAVCKVRTN